MEGMTVPPANVPKWRERLSLMVLWEQGGRHSAQLWGWGGLPGAEWKAQWELGGEQGREGLPGRAPSMSQVTEVGNSWAWESFHIFGAKGPI